MNKIEIKKNRESTTTDERRKYYDESMEKGACVIFYDRHTHKISDVIVADENLARFSNITRAGNQKKMNEIHHLKGNLHFLLALSFLLLKWFVLFVLLLASTRIALFLQYKRQTKSPHV